MKVARFSYSAAEAEVEGKFSSGNCLSGLEE